VINATFCMLIPVSRFCSSLIHEAIKDSIVLDELLLQA
jgi:hypothetical protein